MQLGTRWSVGAQPPRLPDPVTETVRSVEAELAEQSVDATSWRWTLTWLESKPVVELDNGTTITYDPATETASLQA